MQIFSGRRILPKITAPLGSETERQPSVSTGFLCETLSIFGFIKTRCRQFFSDFDFCTSSSVTFLPRRSDASASSEIRKILRDFPICGAASPTPPSTERSVPDMSLRSLWIDLDFIASGGISAARFLKILLGSWRIESNAICQFLQNYVNKSMIMILSQLALYYGSRVNNYIPMPPQAL